MGNKNIVLCSDGTGNRDIKGRGTNVFKLYEAVDIQGHKENQSYKPQLAFYDDGIGSSSFLPVKIIGGVLGWGFSKNVRDLYTELVHVYEPGDSLYLFGFSRGGYTIRALAGMIQYCGIVDVTKDDIGKDKEELKSRVNACWKQFKTEFFKPFQRDINRRRNVTPADAAIDKVRRQELGAVMHPEYMPNGEPTIEFVGVWDTVAAIGAPVEELRDIFNFFIPVKFADLLPGSHIKRACHALSIDDERRSFHPELWNEAKAKDNQIEQVWFAGAHSNVGGGYPKQGMSFVALDWMMAEAVQCGLRFIRGDQESVRAHQDIHGKLYDSRAGLGLYYRWGPRDIVTLCRDHNINVPKIHVSVFERIANGTDGYAPGNIPFACKVVTTQSSTLGGFSPWPAQAAIEAIKQEIAQPSPPAGGCLMDTVRLTIWSGILSYYAFFGSTVLALWWLYKPPSFFENTAGISWARGLVVGLFLVVGGIILAWSHKVDHTLDATYSSFWGIRRKRLRELLDEQDGRDTYLGPMLPERAASEVWDRETTTILLTRRTRTTKGVE